MFLPVRYILLVGPFSPDTDRVENQYIPNTDEFLPVPYVFTSNPYFSSISNQKTLGI